MPASSAPSPARVLVVEDSDVLRAVIEAGLALSEHVVSSHADAESALLHARGFLPDVVLLDRLLPGMDGLAMLAELQRDDQLGHVPVVMMTSTDDSALVAAALDAGAHDLLRKPFAPEELLARVNAAVRVKRTTDRLASQARTDELTGLPNRRALAEHLERWVAHCERHDEPLSAVMVDVDDFKAVNDRFGYPHGDAVLVEVGARLRAAARTGDVVSRWGGDEFMVLLPVTAAAEARQVAERLVAAVCAAPVVLDGREVQVRVRAGVAASSGPALRDGAGPQLLRAVAAALLALRADPATRAAAPSVR